MERTTDQWYLSRDGEVFDVGPYGSQDDALAAGLEMYRDLSQPIALLSDLYYDGWLRDDTGFDPSFHVGRRINHVPTIDADMVIEWLQSNAYEECGECSEGWLDDVPAEELDRLQRALQTALDRWLRHVGEKPTFFTVTDTSEVDPRDYEIAWA